jgi:hypothetical protein
MASSRSPWIDKPTAWAPFICYEQLEAGCMHAHACDEIEKSEPR